jgi:hypothetical protein
MLFCFYGERWGRLRRLRFFTMLRCVVVSLRVGIEEWILGAAVVRVWACHSALIIKFLK